MNDVVATDRADGLEVAIRRDGLQRIEVGSSKLLSHAFGCEVEEEVALRAIRSDDSEGAVGGESEDSAFGVAGDLSGDHVGGRSVIEGDQGDCSILSVEHRAAGVDSLAFKVPRDAAAIQVRQSLKAWIARCSSRGVDVRHWRGTALTAAKIVSPGSLRDLGTGRLLHFHSLSAGAGCQDRAGQEGRDRKELEKHFWRSDGKVRMTDARTVESVVERVWVKT